MAITSSLTLTSGADDLLSDALSLSVVTSLTTAGNSTAISQTSGLARTNFLSGAAVSGSKVIYRAGDATTSGANKVYLKNMSALATEFFTVFIDQEEMGRLYAGDFAFFPWSATQGTLETFTVIATGTVAVGEAITGDTLVESGDGNFTMPITLGVAGTRSEADIVVVPSVNTTMDLEHMLFKQ